MEYMLKNDMNFRSHLSEFLLTFNPNIDWNREISGWLYKNKDEKQIYELIRSASWVDQNETIDEHLLEKYIMITSCLSKLTSKHVKILNYKPETVSTKIEQEMELYRRILEAYLKSRLISFEYIDEVEDNCIDFGWICIEDIDDIWKNKSLIHLNYRMIDQSEPVQYVKYYIDIYLNVFKD